MQNKKIIFIENRVNIYPLTKIAEKLIKKDIKVYWLVQNNSFVPKNGIIYKIPYPKVKDLKKKNSFKDLLSKDRNIKFFNSKDDHYEYYFNIIKKIILNIKPDIVIGEATLFHELLTIKICKKLKIKYLFMQSARILIERLCFYDADNLNYIFGENKRLSNNNLKKIILNLKSEKSFVYDKTLKNQSKNFFYNIYFWFKIFFSNFNGERYNTPNIFIKFLLEIKLFINKLRWNFYSLNFENKIFEDDSFKILYPMQLQPEQNIDVWGYPYNDQLKIIKSLLKICKKTGSQLFIKLNPKSKYELNSKIFALKKNNKNLLLLNKNFKIAGNLKKFNLIFSITGSILIEAALNKVPAVTFVKSKIFELKGIKIIKQYRDLLKIIYTIKNKKFLFSSDKELKNYINYTFKNSYSIKRLNYNYSNINFNKKHLNKISNLIYEILYKQKKII